MEIKNWFELTFEIETNLEEIIIWKLNDLGISSYAFEILLNNKNNKKVIIWLPNLNWSESLRIKLVRNIKEVLDKNNYQTNCFEWNLIEQEEWISSWKKYWGPELVGDNLLVLPCWLELSEEYKNKKVIKIDPGAGKSLISSFFSGILSSLKHAILDLWAELYPPKTKNLKSFKFSNSFKISSHTNVELNPVQYVCQCFKDKLEIFINSSISFL